MSEAYLFAVQNEPHARKATDEERRTVARRGLLGAVVFLAVIAVLEVVFHFLVAPRMLIERISVESEVSLTDRQILDVAGIQRKEYYFSLDPEVVRQNLESYPLVRQAYVEKVFPNTLRLVLYARRPLAVSVVNLGERSVPVAFDEDGVVFQIGQSLTHYDLPVVSGLRFQDLKLGMRIPSALVPFLRQLHELSVESPKLLGLISEFRVVNRGGAGYEIIVYPAAYRLPVRMGQKLSAESLKYVFMVLDVVSREGYSEGLEELDFRTGQMIYTSKGE
jgi:cell division protein FtsQ